MGMVRTIVSCATRCLVDLEAVVPRSYDRTMPLGWAARRGQSEFVRFALANGFDPRLPESPAWASPVAWARRRGHNETAKLLNAGVATGNLVY